jgi:hypothetical protein
MELFAEDNAQPPRGKFAAWVNPFGDRARRKTKTRTMPAKPTSVRVVDSNAETKLSPAGDRRTCGDHRHWITPREERFRHGHWMNRRLKIVRGMEAAGYNEGRLERFINCGSFSTVVQDVDTGEAWVRGSCCHDRFCSPCTRARALLIADNLEAKIKDDTSDYLHVVLTMKHRQEELGPQIDRLFKSFARLRTRKLFRNCVDGGAAFLQLHVSDNDGLWHVHFHLLARGQYLDKFQLSSEWLLITGDSSNVDVSKVIDARKAVKEVCRYAAKPVDSDTLEDPDKLAEMMRALTGRRLCFTFGSWRLYALTRKAPADPEQRLEVLGRLDDLVQRAEAGEQHAKQVLEILFTRSHPRTGPPDLYADKWRLS